MSETYFVGNEKLTAQKFKWYTQTERNEGFNKELSDIRKKIRDGKIEDAKKQIGERIDYYTRNRGYETEDEYFGVMLYRNVRKYGKNAVVNAFFYQYISLQQSLNVKGYKEKSEKPLTPKEKQTLLKLEKEIKTKSSKGGAKEKVRYGINKDGKKIKGVRETYRNKDNKLITRIRDNKTGKLIKTYRGKTDGKRNIK
jgi:hypothetical protein